MLTIPIDAKLKLPLYEQIYRFLKNEIQVGNLNYNDKLPSTRNLATHLQVSRNTIDMAYGQLLSEGYIESYPKKGYFVSQIGQLVNINKHFPKEETEILSTKYQYDFSPFEIDLNHFPYNTFRKLYRNCLNDDNGKLFLLGNSQGDNEFRKSIANYLHESRGVNCSKEQVVIGAGADYLLQLLVQLLDNNYKIAMENPTYTRAYKIFTGLNVKTTAIPLDKSGISISKLYDSDADIAYVTPSHQYPLGIVMPVNRRQELLDWASKNNHRYIIEDDHDSEFRYKGKPIPALAGMDTNEKVIYMGTFSRAVAPAIRIGYMVLPNTLLNIYREKFSYYSSTVSRIDQSVVTTFINDGYFERHLNKMRKIYKYKHDLMLRCLKPLDKHLHYYGENAGLHFVVRITTSYSEEYITNLMAKNGIKLYGLKEHFIETPLDTANNTLPAFLFGYANMSEENIINGVNLLLKIFKDNNILN